MSAPRRLTRVEIRAFAAEEWVDFKAHWPMELAYVLGQMGGGFLFGVCFGLAAFVAVLQAAVAV